MPAPLRLIWLLLVGAPLLVGCETSFDPFEESDVQFSMFGYLDVMADTQFVRVGTLQQAAFDDRISDAVVTLHDLDRDRVVTLQDSLFTYPNGAVANNFWTTQRIYPVTTYRLTARSPDGDSASVLIDTPARIPFPELESGLSPYSSPDFPPTAQSLTVFGAEKLADVRVTYHLATPHTTVTLQYLDQVQRTASGRFTLSFDAYQDVQNELSTQGCPGLRAASVRIAVTNEAWPDFLELDAETLALPATASNVEGGLGFVGAILTMSTAWDNLTEVFALNQAGCD